MTLSELQDWTGQLDPTIAFLLMGSLFLVASVAGWHVSNLILWLRH
jgi:hypothetical protein